MSKVIVTYTLPESARKEVADYEMPTKIGMRALSADEELQAHRVGRAEYMRTQYDATKRSIAEFDGKAASYANGEVDKFWERCGPKVRSLLLQAYNRATSPVQEDEQSFFASAEIQVS